MIRTAALTVGLLLATQTASASAAPELSISAPVGPHVVQPGTSIVIPVTLTRRDSSGTVRVRASGLPFGTSVPSVDSTRTTASSIASSTTVNLPLTAVTAAPPALDTRVTITASPLSPQAGSGNRSVTVLVRVLVLYDLQVTGIEPTQGIQRTAFSTQLSATSARYAGVPLQYNGRTIVRVYGNTSRGGRNVPGVTARLFGFNQAGSALPGSPLFPDGGSRSVAPGAPGPSVTPAERIGAAAAWTFTVPLSWTGFGRPGPVNPFTQTDFLTTLRAELSVPAGDPSFRECTGCAGNDKLTLNQLVYSPTCCVDFASAVITARGGSTPRPIDQILASALNVTPLETDLPPYQATLDLSNHVSNIDGTTKIDRAAAYDALLTFNQNTGGGEVALGILSPEFSDASGQTGWAVFNDLPSRPLTSSAHELGHALGRPHASPSCNGAGEAWPPDDTGLIQGVGLDRTQPSPYQPFATPAALDVRPATLPTAAGGGNPSAFYDFMSGCANEANAWISAKGWTDILRRWPRGTLQAAQLGLAAASPRLQVNGSVGPAGAVRITSVRPLTARRQRGFGPTPYRLVVRDAAGAMLATVPMLGSGSPGAAADLTVLTAAAAVDPARARSVQITGAGQVLASRQRSPNAPRGAFLRPRRGTLVGRRKRVAIRWRARDADGDRLEAIVEWSPRGGRPGTWRTVLLGPNGGLVRLPSDYFGGSRRAFLRLRISDGFNETVVSSPPFRTVHRPPRVRITTPLRGARVRRDASLVLSAVAFDEASMPIVGRRLRWFDGRRPLGRGEGLQVTRLRPGLHRIRVSAGDAAGRRATASVKVRVLAVAPSLTVLDAPRRLSRRARSVTLRIAASLPSRLVVRGGPRRKVARVGLRTSRVRVPVVPRARLLRLRLAITADGRTRTIPVYVDRR